jgi:thiamine kinase-like enzyme
MTCEVLPRAADAEYLADVFRRAGVMGDGRVREVKVESSSPQLVSRIIRLRLAYDGATDGPASVILKIGLPIHRDGPWDIGRREVEFYTQVAPLTSTGLALRCFDAAFDAETKEWHLLLEDLTHSHEIATAWPLPPSREQCERMVGALARIHAEWWDHPRLGISVGQWLDNTAIEQLMRRFSGLYEAFADRLGDRLSPGRRELYDRFIDAAPRQFARHQSRRNLSIVHGDAHVWNYFLPRDGGGDIRLFDWDAWRIGVAATDLAYMMATHWYPERRQRLERALLDRYHAALLAHGVHGYARSDLQDDYRLAVLLQLMTPVWQAALNLPPMIWWGHLERIMWAVDDLGCRDLLA